MGEGGRGAVLERNASAGEREREEGDDGMDCSLSELISLSHLRYALNRSILNAKTASYSSKLALKILTVQCTLTQCKNVIFLRYIALVRFELDKDMLKSVQIFVIINIINIITK